VWIWNRRQGLGTPALHVTIARWLERSWLDGRRELLLLAFRNSGKSTIVGLFCAWLLCRDPALRILVLSGEFSLARKMARNVRRIVERHPLARHLRPTRGDEWAADHFTVARRAEWRDPSVLAKGIAANITGVRSDVVICDDVEVPNTCDTAEKRETLRTRLAEIDYVLVPGGAQLFVGTPHTAASIYAPEAPGGGDAAPPLLAGFDRLELPLLDARGLSRWPERFPADRIARIRARSGPAKFDSQMLLRPRAVEDGRLDPDLLVRYDAELVYTEGNRVPILSLDGRRLVSATCWWDPSFGAPGRGDASVVAVVFTDADGHYFLHRIRYLSHDPARLAEVDAATQACRQVAAFADACFVPAVTIETNGLGRFLPGLLRQALRDRGVGAAVIEHTARHGKALRIIDAFDAVLAASRLRAHASVWATPFIAEMRDWRPGGGGRDDGLDAVAGCLLAEPVRLTRLAALPGGAPPPRAPWRGGAVAAAEGDFDL
jgi:hypothetical protein